MSTECQCSDDYGPCEDHCDVLVVREGASLRTADESAMQLVEDLIACGVELSEEDAAEHSRLDDSLTNAYDPSTGTAWLEQDDSEAAAELARRIEQDAGELWVTHDDGYTVVRPHDDCPLLEG